MEIRTAAPFVLAGILTWTAAGHAQAPARNTAYARMAPLGEYLMDRDAEVALARSAAPASISGDATIMVLARQGYETAIEGKNGFVCAVGRSWLSPFGDTQFWNSKERSPACYNPAAARSMVPLLKMLTAAVLAGVSKEEIASQIKTAYADQRVPALEPGAMAYMMGKKGYLNDAAITSDGAHNLAHVMFFAPPPDSENWGADLPGSPLHRLGTPSPINVFIMLTGVWSDGTPAAH